MPTVAIGTLGCKLNQYESHSILSDFINANYSIAAISEYADIYIINTCTVTVRSDAKSRKMVQRCIRQNPDALVIVTGCYAQTNEEAIQDIQGVDYIIGNDKKNTLLHIVEQHRKYGKTNTEDITGDVFGYTIPIGGPHTRAYLKIQDGCDRYCTYCKIPLARGEPVSRPVNEVIDHAQQLIENDFKEIVLTGINISDYTYFSHGKKYSLSDLAHQISLIPGDFRVHLSSIEPDTKDRGLYQLILQPKIVRHIHLPLQSGSDAILKKMGRNYTCQQYINIIAYWKETLPDINLTTDLIIGFPTETDDDFQKSRMIIEEVGFYHVHTFRYSEREGTKAASLNPKVNDKVKDERSLIIRQCSQQSSNAYKHTFTGKSVRILVEDMKDDHTGSGLTDHYVRFRVTGNTVSLGQFHNAVIQDGIGIMED